MQLKKIIFLILFMITTCIQAQPANEGWSFVWLSSGPNQFEISKGSAIVNIKNGKIEATMVDSSKVEYRLTGSIKSHSIKAKLTILESDYFIGSPFSGTYSVKRWDGDPQSLGRESIILTDGWNVVAFTREIAKQR